MEFKHSPEEARRLWLDALRSGEYKQGRRQLRSNALFCCLGVLCDLFAKYEGGGWTDDDGFKVGNDRGDEYLPIDVRDWVGLSQIDGEYDTSALVNDNDEGCSFVGIADKIESNPPGLFRENVSKPTH